jgi:hypothetical protein
MQAPMNADPTPIAADKRAVCRADVIMGTNIQHLIGGNRRGIGVHRRFQSFSPA